MFFCCKNIDKNSQQRYNKSNQKSVFRKKQETEYIRKVKYRMKFFIKISNKGGKFPLSYILEAHEPGVYRGTLDSISASMDDGLEMEADVQQFLLHVMEAIPNYEASGIFAKNVAAAAKLLEAEQQDREERLAQSRGKSVERNMKKRNNLTFTVIDKVTGKYPDLTEIAKTKAWAKGVLPYDMDEFAVREDGSLVLLDKYGNYVVCPDDLFEVLESRKGKPEAGQDGRLSSV